MKNGLFMFSRWFYCFVSFISAALVSNGASSVNATGPGGSYARQAITSVIQVSTSPERYAVTGTYGLRTAAPAVAPSASVGGVAGAIFGRSLTGNTLTDEGTFSLPSVAPYFFTIGGVTKKGWVLRGAVGAIVDQQYYVIGEECPNVNYDYTLPGTFLGGTTYQIWAYPDGGTEYMLHQGVAPWGRNITFSGTLPSFCGDLVVLRKDDSDTSDFPWKEYTPPPSPPPPLPNPPSPPPPDDPTPPPPTPPDNPPPPSPPPPSPPPSGGGGGDPEIIEWLKDSNEVQRGISERQDVANEWLKQIKENTDYANDRLKGIEESSNKISDDVERKKALEEWLSAEISTPAQMADQAASATEALQSAAGSLAYSVAPVAVSTPAWTMAFSAGGRSITMNYNPFGFAWMNTACDWIRLVAAWALAYYYLRWCLDKIIGARRHVEITPQTRGNQPVPGVSGGQQVTAAVAAALITATMLSMMFVLYAMWRDGAIFTFNVSNLFSTAPFVSGAPEIVKEGLWVLEKLFPVNTALVVMANYMTFAFQVEASVIAGATFKRFMNP